MFKIESDIPVPVSARVTSRTSKYPLRDMADGQSFFIENLADEAAMKRARGAVFSAAKTAGCKVITRPMTDEKTGVPGLRVWKNGPKDEAQEEAGYDEAE